MKIEEEHEEAISDGNHSNSIGALELSAGYEGALRHISCSGEGKSQRMKRKLGIFKL